MKVLVYALIYNIREYKCAYRRVIHEKYSTRIAKLGKEKI